MFVMSASASAVSERLDGAVKVNARSPLSRSYQDYLKDLFPFQFKTPPLSI
jgi:hypothetical protein